MIDQYLMLKDEEHLAPSVHQKILMVDDEPRLAESLRYLLGMRGYDQQACTTGMEAISLLGRENFDLILLDLGLPDVSGHDLLERVRHLASNTPIIIVSGENSIDAAIDALRKGVYDFVRKPYDPEQLLRTIEHALRETTLEKTNKLINEKLEHSRNLYRYLVDSSPDIIYTLDIEGRFSFVNERVESLLGFPRKDLIGKHYSFLVFEEDIDRAKYVFNERRRDDRAAQNIELRLKCKTGDERFRHFESSFVTIVLKSQGLYGVQHTEVPFLGTYGVARDISDRKKAEAIIHYQAYHDSLTDLPNRVLFRDRLGLAIAQAQRSGEQFAIMFLDLDRFKLVNDTMGHLYGDELLKVVASRLSKCLRKGDTLARVGGDEFTLLLPKCGTHENVRKMASKILHELNDPFFLDGHETYVSGSIGVAIYPEHGDSADMLIKCADIAMYHVKWEGKNGYMFYNPTMNAIFHRKLAMENELRRALDSNHLTLYYQPQVDVENARIVGMEVLVRWIHPEQGMLPPSEFIPLAEETGLITRVTEWVLAESAKQYREWKKMGIHDLRMSLNFSPRDIEREDFVSMIQQHLDANGLEGKQLEIEITEGTLMRDMENTILKLKELHTHGIKVAIDDFGTCYSSLSYIKKFPVNTIKIDKSFVHDIQIGHDVPLIAAITAIAHGFRMNLIAEGVETPEQLIVLSSLGCREMQGFLFSRPLGTEEATEILFSPERLFARATLPEKINPLKMH
jgi:diguanylate cyclase (GGDEF)-like protein/PAS domain S-box-containing protein